MNVRLFHTRIFSWFKTHGRILPWREKHGKAASSVRDETIASYFSRKWNRDPYNVIISELMLQQTQVDRVIPKFEEFLQAFPTVRALAKAKRSEVLVLWKGLGYNRRALYLHKMAKVVVGEHDGVFPKSEEELRKLPGVGEYTARAVLAFGYGKDVGVIDTNIKRIYARVLFGGETSALVTTPKEFAAVVDQTVPKGKGDPWNQALMDFGALICTAKRPKCAVCPLQTTCEANISAKRQRYLTYEEMLRSNTSGVKKKGKKTKKFEETDRYFRGKIVAKLREGPFEMNELRLHMETLYGLGDRARFGKIIEGLKVDGLLKIRHTRVSLPD